jgi:hypothetical protein
MIRRKRGTALVAACAVAIGAAVLVVPALADDSTVTATSTATDFDAASAVRLHLGSDGKSFYYPDGDTPANTEQDLGANGCRLTSSATIVKLSATAGTTNKPVGLVGNGIGVKGSSTSTGTPCGQVDGAETLTLATGDALGGRLFTGVRLDLEMTGNAVAELTLTKGADSRSYFLQTGRGINPNPPLQPLDTTVPYEVTSGPTDSVVACAAQNSSGPNSGPNDNCLWTVDPGFAFDTVKLATVPGTVSLEGSGDFGNDPAFDSLFYLTAPNNAPTVIDHDFEVNGQGQTLEGNVLDGASDPDDDPLTAAVVTPPASGTLTLLEPPSLPGAFTYVPVDVDVITTVTFTYRASDGTDVSNVGTVTITIYPVMCRLETVATEDPGSVNGSFTRLDDQEACKRYTVEVQPILVEDQLVDTVLFQPSGAEGAPKIAYRGVVTFGPDIDPPAGADSLRLRYDPTGNDQLVPMQWCLAPQFNSDIQVWDVSLDDEVAPVTLFATVTSAGLPVGESWCIASTYTQADERGDKVVYWQLYGMDDPRTAR